MAIILKVLLIGDVDCKMQNELATLDFNETPFLGTALNQLKLSPEQVDLPLTILNQGPPPNSDHKQLVNNILTKLERYQCTFQ